MKKYFLFLLSVVLISCGKFQDGTSVWSGGLWIVPWILGLGSAWSFYRGYKQWTSGSRWVETNPYGPPVVKTSDKRVPPHKIGAFVFGCILFIAMIITIIMVNSDK